MAGHEWQAHVCLVLVQLAFAGYHVLSKLALSNGVNQLVFCTYRDVLAFAVLAPVAYFGEKRIRPPLTRRLFFIFMVLGLTGIFGNHLLFLVGLNYTSPAYASALQPTTPVFTFILAVLMGTEHVDWTGRSGIAKVGGTVLCIFGATFMAIFKGPILWGDGFLDMHMQGAVFGKPSPEPVGRLAEVLLDVGIDTWQVGILCLICNCFCMAFYMALQAPLLAKYPAGVSVTAYSYLFGAAFITLSGFIGARELNDWVFTRLEWLGVVYAGLISSALSYGLLTCSNKILGPTLVTLYLPLQPVFSTTLSAIFLKSSIYTGSVVGGCLIAAGLYCVTWGRREGERLGITGPYRRISRGPELESGDLNNSLRDPLHKVLYLRSHILSAGSTLPLPRVKADKSWSS